MFVLSFIFFFSIFFFFFFQPPFLVLLFSLFFFFFINFFFQQSLVRHVYFFFLSVFNLLFLEFFLSGQLLIICLLHFSIAYESPSFLSFFFALKYPGCSFLNHPNFYSFSQQNSPLKTIQNPSPRIFRYTWFRQNSAHILIISKPLFPNTFLNKKPHSPTPWGDSQNIRLPRQTHKKISVS